ncbi:MAG: dihydropteroate synthase [Myxococcota bacterium]|nr:dihydropteroate synthase [Myxococcota bacterium]
MASPESDTTVDMTKRNATTSGPTLLGVLNLSPESMVSDSIAQTSEEILARAASLRAAGVEILDVGGRSITPDAPMIDDATEQRRLLPAIELLVRSGYRVSADTWSSETGIAALDSGAEIVNFTGQSASHELLTRVRNADATLCLTYMPYGNAYQMRTARPVAYRIAAVCEHLASRLLAAREAGVENEKLIVDPNLGILHPDTDDYTKAYLQLEVLEHIDELRTLGCPLLLYAARKPERLARILFAQLVLQAQPEYVRTHEPEIIRRLQAAARESVL